MNRRDFSKTAALGAIAAPFISASPKNEKMRYLYLEDTKVPLGMDAHSVSLMRWKADRLIDYAIELKMHSILFNSLAYFDNLDDKYLTGLHQKLKANSMRFHFGVGCLSINSPNYTSRFGSPKDLILHGLRVARIFKTTSVNCKIGNIADRYTDGGIQARMEELINELRAMRSQIQDAGLKFAVENHAGDMRSEEVMQIVEAVGTDICGVMLDPGNSVWAMENPMQQLEKLGRHVLCTSVRDYKIWESEKGATFQWTALGDGTIDFQNYTKRMSELCPDVPLHIETVSNRPNEIPFLTREFWEGYPDLKAADLLDFYQMLRAGEQIEVKEVPEGVDANIFAQKLQHEELRKSIDFLRTHCELIK